MTARRSIGKRVTGWIGSGLKLFGLFVFTVLCSQYFRANYYHFPAPRPFSGNQIYNPYADISGSWLKSNFHAHAYAWSGITNGHQSEEEIITHYKKDLGYDAPAISNYHKTSPYLPADSPLYFPVYEHGNNIGKTHHLVFGNEKVCFYDVVLWQNVHHKQTLIQHLAKKNRLVTLNHPGMKNSYSYEDLEKLSGYQLMEVINTPGNDQAYWDQALSAGKLSWIIANDDAHDITKPNETGVSWTMVNSPQRNADAFLKALGDGRCYGVTGQGAINKYYLRDVKVTGDEIFINVDSGALEIKLIGQGGVEKKVVKNTDTIVYKFTASDSYIRAVIRYPDMIMHLNPLVRYDGKGIPGNEMTATVNTLKTWLMRLLIFTGWLLVILFSFRSTRRLLFLKEKRTNR